MKRILTLALALLLCLSFVPLAHAEQSYKTGDVNGDGGNDSADAIHLLYYILFGAERYPVDQSVDFDKSGEETSADAVYLLYYVLFGQARYPIGDYAHKADVTDIREQLEAIPKVDPSMTTDELRRVCVDFMKLSVSFQWIPDRDFSYDGTPETTFYLGKLEGGVPYISTASGNLYRWLEYYDSETGLVNCADIEKSPLLFGNACSGAAGWAWARVINSAEISWTSNMNVAHGFIILGDYTYDTSIETMWVKNSDGTRTYYYKPKDVCKENGYQVMYESYALALPADCFSSGGHARMCAEEPVVVRNSDGTINGNKSYVVMAEQGLYNSGEHHTRYTADGTSYQIRGNDGGKWTFRELFDEGYLIHTFAEFLGTDPAEKAEASIPFQGSAATVTNLATGNLTANYPISDVFFSVFDDGGSKVYSYTKRMTRHYVKSFALSKTVPGAELKALAKSGSYTVRMDVLLSTGDVITLFDGQLLAS